MSRRLRLSLLVFTAASLAAGAASAQTYSRAVVFGDSLSDNGNLYNATAHTNPPSPPYFQGRFSNGPVWVELLFPNMRQVGTVTGNTNYAFGGARTDNQANPPGMLTQYNLYRSQGGTFSASDVVTVLGGANDIFQAFPGAASNPATAQAVMTGVATTAAGNIGTLVRNVAGAGAGTVLVSNLPNLGVTPQFSGAPSQLATFTTDTFNGALFGQLQAAAAANPTRNIIYMDLNRAQTYVTLNPSAFGFTNITQPCLNTATGVACANPDQYAYWDGVHPTAAAHRFIAGVATDYLYYGRLSAPTAVEAETSLEHRRRSTDGAYDRLWSAGPGEGTRASLTIDGGSATSDARGDVSEADFDTAALRFAADGMVTSNMRGGLQIGYTQSDVAAGALSFNTRSYAADAYVGWRGEQLFVDAVVGGGFDEYRDVRRQTVVAAIRQTGHTEGYNLGASARVGMRYDMGGGVLSPRVGLDAFRSQVDGYEEDGFLARHDIGDREINAIAAQASVRYDTRLGEGLNAYVEGGYRDYLAYDGDDVSAGLVANTAQRLYTSVDEPDGGVGIVSAGVSGQLGDRWTLSASYRGRFGSEYSSNAGMVTLGMRF